MKRFISLFITMVFCLSAIPALAATVYSKVPFANTSGASAAVSYSDVYNVIGKKDKTFQVRGVTLTSSPTSITFKNMSGTVLAECSPTGSDPWATCVANDYAQTAISRTTDGIFSWRDLSSYVRFKWTAGTVGGKLKAWFNYSE